MVTLMLDEPAGQGGAAGGGGPGRGSGSGGGGGTGSKGYGVLRSIRLGSNMVVRGLYTSDKVYSPQTLPKDIALPVRGGGAWEDTYGWLWLPEVRGGSGRINGHFGGNKFSG